jgi:hypothetical protein
MRSELPPSALPGISPTRGEIGWARPLAPTSVVWGDAFHMSISPLVGEMSGRTEGGSPTHQGMRANPHAH